MPDTLHEYIGKKLVINGFAVEQVGEHTVKTWPRGTDLEEASFTIGPVGDKYVIQSGTGRFAGKRMRQVMNHYLSQWTGEYKLGAR